MKAALTIDRLRHPRTRWNRSGFCVLIVVEASTFDRRKQRTPPTSVVQDASGSTSFEVDAEEPLPCEWHLHELQTIEEDSTSFGFANDPGVDEAFLEGVVRLAGLGDLQGATDEVYSRLDGLLNLGKFHECDVILGLVDVEAIPSALIRSFLAITHAAKKLLPARVALYQRAMRRMIQLRGEEVARRLIGRLA